MSLSGIISETLALVYEIRSYVTSNICKFDSQNALQTNVKKQKNMLK